MSDWNTKWLNQPPVLSKHNSSFAENMSPSELKKLRNKQKKAKRKAEAEAALPQEE